MSSRLATRAAFWAAGWVLLAASGLYVFSDCRGTPCGCPENRELNIIAGGDKPRPYERNGASRLSLNTYAGLPAAAAPPSAAQTPAPPLDLAARLQQLADDPALKGLACAACVADLETGQELFALNAQTPLIPASNMKLVPTAAALATLGPDWRFRTFVGALGDDLAVIGGGDPNLSGRFYGGDTVAAIRQWAQVLKSRGVKNVKGNLLFDDSLFDSEWRHPDWPAADLAHWYAAPVGALVVNDSCVDIHVSAGPTLDSPATVLLDPATAYFNLKGAIVTRNRRGDSFRIDLDPATHTLNLAGGIRPGAAERVVYRPVDDPGLYAATVIKETLAAEGLPIAGGVVRKRLWTTKTLSQKESLWQLPKEFVPHVVHTSSLAQTVGVANTRSQNLYAECLLKVLAAYAESPDPKWPRTCGSWVRARLFAAKGLERLGVTTLGCAFSDGSGLSEHNRIPAKTFVQILLKMAKGPAAAVWMDSLADAGDEEGTLRRLRDERLVGRLTAKSGYISAARALSGYVRTTSGRTLAFSLLVNAGPARAMDHAPARAWFSETCLAMVDY